MNQIKAIHSGAQKTPYPICVWRKTSGRIAMARNWVCPESQANPLQQQ